MNINTIKWTSTFFILSGILMAQFEMYPYYIFAHSLGAIGWLISGYLMNDKAVMTNFGLQIPIFIIGYINYFVGQTNLIKFDIAQIYICLKIPSNSHNPDSLNIN